VALVNSTTNALEKPTEQTESGLFAFYNIRPGN